LSRSQQPLVPQSLMLMGGRDGQGAMSATSLAGNLISLLLAEKAGLNMAPGAIEDPGKAPQTPTGLPADGG
jgi:hypothetical protein